jgi:hypothetical protein
MISKRAVDPIKIIASASIKASTPTTCSGRAGVEATFHIVPGANHAAPSFEAET